MHARRLNNYNSRRLISILIIYSHRQCCACYGPRRGTKNYCLKNCTAINGGTVTKNAHTWIWIRSSVPKRAWRKCIEYIKTDSNGIKHKYRINEDTGIEEKVHYYHSRPSFASVAEIHRCMIWGNAF